MRISFTFLFLFIFLISTLDVFSQLSTYTFSGKHKYSHAYTSGFIIQKDGEHIITGGVGSDSIFINDKFQFLNRGYSGGSDGLILKYDKSGNLLFKKQLWSQTAKNPIESSYSGDVGVLFPSEDEEGNLYVLADFYADTIHIDDTIEMVGNGEPGYMLIKLDKYGNILLNKIIISNESMYPSRIIDMVVDKNGNLTLIGELMGNIELDTLKLSGVPYFIARFSSSGKLVWVNPLSIDRNGHFNFMGLTQDGVGNYYITGRYRGAYLSLGNDTLKNQQMDGLMMFARFDSTGKYNFIKQSAAYAFPQKLKADTDGSFYIGGIYDGKKIDLGNNISYSSVAGENFFFAKYNNNGAPLWVKTAYVQQGGFNGFDFDLYVDKTDTIILSAAFQNDTLKIDGFSLPNKFAGRKDIFLSVFNKKGEIKSALSFGGLGSDFPTLIKKDEQNNIFYLAGHYQSPSIQIENYTFYGSGLFQSSFIAPIQQLYKTTGIFETATGNYDLKVYPNPTSGNITIEFVENTESVKEITLYDITGREVRNFKNIRENKFIIQSEGLQKGLYLLQVIDKAGNLQQGKIIFE